MQYVGKTLNLGSNEYTSRTALGQKLNNHVKRSLDILYTEPFPCAGESKLRIEILQGLLIQL